MQQQVQGYRISPQQRRLWKWGQESAYRDSMTQITAVMSGLLDDELFQAALEEVVRRNEILRSQFQMVPGMAYPVQVVLDAVSVELHVHDWRGASVAEQQAWADELMRANLQQPFELASGPLFRFERAMLGEGRQFLLLSTPAMCMDEKGLHNVLAELIACYVAGAKQTQEEDLPVPYSAVSEWWNELLESKDGESGRGFWKQQVQLEELTNSRLLPEQRVSEEKTTAVRSLHVSLDSDVNKQMEMAAHASGGSLETFLHVAWQVLLQKITGQENIVIGTACDGRMEEEIVGVPGLFARYIPIRSLAQPHQTYQETLQMTEQTMREAYVLHETFGWEQFNREDMVEEPYFPFGFDYLSAQVVAGGGLSISPLSATSCIDRFDVRLSVLQVADGLQIKIYFDVNRYSEQEMQHVLNAYAALLKHAVSAPDRAVAELGLLDESECRQLLASMHDTRVDFDMSLRLHELFEAQVERTPQHVAVTFDEESLTYAELNLRANRLARQLVNLGVGSGKYVGIFVERSHEMVIALLATLKAGAAYVPLDPGYPQDRIDFMVKDAQLSVLLTLKRLEEQIGHVQAQVIALDVFDLEDASDGQADADNLHIEISAEDPAYVIYTSGTTGQPKGVVVPHRAICNHMLWMQETFPLQQGDRVLQKTPFSFDASVWEFYAPLLAGAELVIAEPGRHMDTSYLSDVIRNRKITTLQLVPTLLQMLLDEPTFATCTSLQRVFCGGEALTPELVERFFLAMPESVDLINLYGPTECCIDSTYHICEPGSRLRTIPIGKPIANAQTLVLDERMQPVPVGVLGELYIGGLGVALGYLHRPELTAERFVRHEFEESSEHTQFLYKTGDQVRRLSDGNLEYVGRADSQVKMRGFRIELGEIEKVIGQHDDVREAVVIAHEYSPGDKRLVGYFVPEASAKPVIDHLRDHLRGKLPDYMVPATFVMLDELPLSPSGKVNRKALPIPELESQQKQATYIAPRNPVEELLERIFGEVLHHDTVSVHDNFFDLGGHSLLVTQVISRIRNAFHITLPFSEMFNDPTIAGLAKRVQRAMNEGRAAQEKPLQTVSRNQALPLSFAQQRLWFLDQFAGTAYNITTPLRLLGALDVHALERSLHEMVRRHESLRTTFAEQDGLSVQVIAPTLDLHVQQTDLSALEAGERDLHVQRLITEETLYRFDLTHGPLIRAHLLRLSAEEHVLLVNMHHIVTDGSSTDIFLQELSRLYLSFVENRPADLPELQVQYADYAHWQRDWLQGEELEKQLMYWKGKLAGKLPVLHLPYDHSRPEFPVNKGLYQWFVIPTAVVAKLQAFSQQEMATLFMTMLATYNVLLHRYSKQEDILVGTPVSNRNRSEVENVIGNFVNTLVMRNHVSDHLTFREFVRAVRETALGAYTHQELPFEKLVEELHPERSRSVSPLFQAWFLLVQAAEPASWGGLQSNLLEVASGSTKWDITLGMVEVPDGYRVVLECSADLFQLSTVEQIAHGYETLIGLVAGEPDMLLRDLFEQLEQAELDYLKQKKAQFNDKWKSKLKRPR